MEVAEEGRKAVDVGESSPDVAGQSLAVVLEQNKAVVQQALGTSTGRKDKKKRAGPSSISVRESDLLEVL